MALINCYECSKEISDSAPACPHCGAPRKEDAPNTAPLTIHPIGYDDKKRETGFLGGLAKLIGFIVIAFVLFSWFGGDDHSSSTKTASEPTTETSSPSNGRPAANELNHFSAQQLADAYDENTVAADQRFKDKWLIIEGVVSETSTDFTGDAYVSLKVSNQFNEPQVKFLKSEESKLAQLRKGQHIRAMCRGDGDVVKTPMLKKCTLLN